MSRRQFLPTTCEWSSSITARSRTVDSERGVRHRGLVVRHRTLCGAQNIVSTKGTKRGPAAQCGKTWWTRNSPKPGWSPQSAVRPPGHQNTTGARSQRHREPAKGGVEVKGTGPAAAHNTLRQRRLAGSSGILKKRRRRLRRRRGTLAASRCPSLSQPRQHHSRRRVSDPCHT